MVRRTLAAAKRITYQGVLDVWLLDEGDDPAVRAVCARARGPALQPQEPARVQHAPG